LGDDAPFSDKDATVLSSNAGRLAIAALTCAKAPSRPASTRLVKISPAQTPRAARPVPLDSQFAMSTATAPQSSMTQSLTLLEYA